MNYVRTNWISGETPLSADNMNNIENFLEQISKSAFFYLSENGDMIEFGDYNEWINKGMPVPEVTTQSDGVVDDAESG